jgi:MFS family permease
MNQALWKNRAFVRIFAGETVSQLGTGLTYVAVMAKFMELTGSTQGWAYLLAMKAVPFLLFGWFAGYAADRFNPCLLLLMAHALRFAIYLGIAFCRQLDVFYWLVFLSSIMETLYIPAYKSLIPRLLEKDQLLGANSLEETVRSSVAILGIACSGLLIGWAGIRACFVLDAMTYGLAALNLLLIGRLPLRMMPIANPISGEDRLAAFRRELGQGFSVIKASQAIRYPVFLSVFLVFLIGFEMPMFLPMAVEKGWNGALATGYTYAAASIGSLFASLLLLRRQESPIRHLWLVSLIILADAGILLGIVLAPRLAVALPVALGLGFTETLFRTYSVTEIQRNTAIDTVGRVFSTLASIQEPIKILSMMLSGIAVSLISARTGLMIAVGLEVAVGLLTALYVYLSWQAKSVKAVQPVQQEIQ